MPEYLRNWYVQRVPLISSWKRRPNTRPPDPALQAWLWMTRVTRLTNYKRYFWISFSIIGTRKVDSWGFYIVKKVKLEWDFHINRHRKMQTKKFPDDLYVIPVKPKTANLVRLSNVTSLPGPIQSLAYIESIYTRQQKRLLPSLFSFE